MKSLHHGSDRCGSYRSVLLFVLLFLSLSISAQAQQVTGSLTVSSSSCTTTSCISATVPTSTNTILLTLSGTWTGTVSFEYNVAGGSYAALLGLNATTLSSTMVSSSTANGSWIVGNPGFSNVRLRASATITGTVTATIRGVNNQGVVIAIPPGAGGGAGTDVNIASINSVTPLMGAGNTGTGSLRVTEATDSVLGATVTSNRIAVNPISGQAGVQAGAGSVSALTQRVTLAADDPLVVAATTASTPILANGLDDSPLVTVKASAGVLDSYYCYNGTGAVAYVQLLDATSPTLGATTPKWSIAIPAGAAGNLSNMNLSFANAIKVASTTTATGSTGATTDCNFGAH